MPFVPDLDRVTVTILMILVVGTGRCRISLLFIPVNVSLPPSLRGWNVGNVLLDKIVARNLPRNFKGAINIRLSNGKRRLTTTIEQADEVGTGELS